MVGRLVYFLSLDLSKIVIDSINCKQRFQECIVHIFEIEKLMVDIPTGNPFGDELVAKLEERVVELRVLALRADELINEDFLHLYSE